MTALGRVMTTWRLNYYEIIFGTFDFSFFRFGILAIEDSDVADDADHFAFGGLRDLADISFFLL